MTYRGIAQKGKRYGTAIGFPTANISFESEESGIFAGKVRFKGREYLAAAYADQGRKILEAHALGYPGGDLYGEEIEVDLLKKMRDDKRFGSEQELKDAIAADVHAVREYFLTEK